MDAPVITATQLLHSDAGQAALRCCGRSFILDLDDTLISNQTHFLEGYARIAEVLERLDRSGRDADVLHHLHRELSISLLPTLGPTPLRWRVGALSFAAQIAERPLTVDETAELLDACEVGLSIGEPLPGTLETLDALAGQVPVVILTRGDRAKQLEKIHTHGLVRMVDAVEIVMAKDAGTFTSVAARHALTDPVSIGDSPTSDIVPALQAGMDAVLITGAPNAGWDGHSTVAPDGAATARDLAEAVCRTIGIGDIMALTTP